ncbi:hypothetical protein AMTR_s00001p00272310 [Amborella trichopoda]|uniref:Uncharacterized protein n=1 Tax=Amborella trichopoda TaxID=13333 RepID=W1NM83_AMBTC|nr:hypothetical protein AMTR_s00001p00272310 [Amborella trichopoda]
MVAQGVDTDMAAKGNPSHGVALPMDGKPPGPNDSSVEVHGIRETVANFGSTMAGSGGLGIVGDKDQVFEDPRAPADGLASLDHIRSADGGDQGIHVDITKGFSSRNTEVYAHNSRSRSKDFDDGFGGLTGDLILHEGFAIAGEHDGDNHVLSGFVDPQNSINPDDSHIVVKDRKGCHWIFF